MLNIVFNIIEDWIQYNDDKVSIVSQDDIQKLDGGVKTFFLLNFDYFFFS
jgi:hypothetical protein